jgi:hypothetical protein
MHPRSLLLLLAALAGAQTPSGVEVLFGDNIPAAVQERITALVAKCGLGAARPGRGPYSSPLLPACRWWARRARCC